METHELSPGGRQRTVAAAQATYYLVTGIWPLFSIKTFQWVTGPKVDLWLVKATGLLIGVIGAVLGLSARRTTLDAEIALLGAGSALSLAGIDLYYVKRRRLRWVYGVDGLGQLALAAGWGITWLRRGRSTPS